MLVADGAFFESGAFRISSQIPAALLVEQLRHAVPDYLVSALVKQHGKEAIALANWHRAIGIE